MTAQTQPEAPKTYDVTLIFDASKSVSVQATSVEEAIYLASDKVDTPSLCHHCSYEIDFGYCTHEIVYLDGEEVEDTDYRVKTISELKERIAQIEAENQQLRRNWCTSYAGASAYTDDGEAQDNRDLPTIDFLRDSVPDIEDKMQRRGLKQLAERSRPALSDEQVLQIAAAAYDCRDAIRRAERAHGIGEPT